MSALINDYIMVALRTSAFASVSNNTIRNMSVCVKEVSVDCNILISMLFKLLRLVCNSGEDNEGSI